ncbi:uncharacterized protein LOC113523016 [Galleria mellonella]|uniref:Uncharacterized protein LOC113523016 n=1 Tax=Galleria mellonella TaxID=7137 RepID=A0A6J1X5I6_GALME|nr:uncharacterized protein LOC113523016 [Galleria mellonella]
MANTNRERNSNRNSVETILTFENRDISQWSTVWSTNNVPGMDNAAGSGPSRRVTGRRRLRTGTLALGAFLTMHCRVTASALTGGFFVFMMFLILSVIMLANPLRHFEIYLGQWSISGPGRAFRIIPVLDGIGIAICINAVIRAITCCTIAAISAIYVIHSVSDDKLPFTYCRNFELKPYEPILKNIKSLRSKESRFSLKTGVFDDDDTELVGTRSSTVGLYYHAWRNVSYKSPRKRTREHGSLRPIEMCNETYSGSYPPLYSTPAYNFFYVEVVQLRKDYNLGQFNIPLVLSIILTWIVIWVLMISEHISHGKLIWNNIYQWLVVVPWCWIVFLIIAAVTSFLTMGSTIHEAFHIGAKEVWAGVSDALQVALYIHSASVGTEIILGKGLNHYASGHIDPQLNKENVWHSGLLLLLITLQSGGVAGCALVDYIQPDTQATYDMHESTMWVIPMYSKCTSFGNYSHFLSTLVFGGLTFSYMTTAFILLKTALHTIFEIRVKLIFIEQFVVGGLILICMGLSLPFATNGGIILLESVDAIMTGVAMPFVCLLELVALLYVYGSHDFISDMNTATEENVCSSRIGSQWRIIPFITVITFVIKISVLVNSELPVKFIYYALVPLAVLVVAIPLRACHNAYFFLGSTPHRST